jgi:hypothetical protein
MKITTNFYITLEDKKPKINMGKTQKKKSTIPKKQNPSFFEKYVSAIKQYLDENDENIKP